jgi:hypothetical protein
VVFRVDQLDKHLVLTGRQTRHADRIVVTRFHPTPRQVVEMYVQMPDPWRYVERACPEHRYDMHILTRYWIQARPWASPAASGVGSTISLGEGSFSMATYGEAPRTSFVLWAKAFVASTLPAVTAASVLIGTFICILSFIDHRRENCRIAQPGDRRVSSFDRAAVPFLMDGGIALAGAG